MVWKTKRDLPSSLEKSGAPLKADGNEMETRTRRFWNLSHHFRPFVDFVKDTARNTKRIVKSMGSEIAKTAKEDLKKTVDSNFIRFLLQIGSLTF